MPAHSILRIGALLGALAVALGAFGAHGLKKLVDPTLLNTYETGVDYHFYHVFGLLLIGIIARQYPAGRVWWNRAAWAFVLGILLFSGSLYALVLSKINSMGWNWLGPITPIGGVFFILGWLAVFLGVRHIRSGNHSQ